MTKNLENKCKHEFVKFVRMQEGLDIPLGNCYKCKNTIIITDKYRHTHNGVYELIPVKINARECRE